MFNRPGFGIDLSKWNGLIGCLSPIVDVVIHKVSEGKTIQDSKYGPNRARVKMSNDHNRMWGGYHLLQNNHSVEEEVENFIKHGTFDKDELICLDLEHKEAREIFQSFGEKGARQRIVDWGMLTLNAVPTGMAVDLVLYTSKRSLEELWGKDFKFEDHELYKIHNLLRPIAKIYKLWIVDYIANSKADIDPSQVEVIDPLDASWWPGEIAMRQYTSSGDGRPLGVPDSTIDFDYIYNLNRLWNCRLRPKVQPVGEARAWEWPDIRTSVSQALNNTPLNNAARRRILNEVFERIKGKP